jgi:hypothetical protein
MSFVELNTAIKNGYADEFYSKIAELLLMALNDWPVRIEPTDLIFELRNQTNNNLTINNIQRYISTLKPETDAWKMEAIESIINIFKTYSYISNRIDVELEEILIQLTLHSKY